MDPNADTYTLNQRGGEGRILEREEKNRRREEEIREEEEQKIGME